MQSLRAQRNKLSGWGVGSRIRVGDSERCIKNGLTVYKFAQSESKGMSCSHGEPN